MRIRRWGESRPIKSRGRAVPKRTMQERLARQAAIERAISRYLHLECGHYSTLETDLFYSNARPRRGVTWCENCNKWVEIAKPPEPPKYPDDPAELF